MSEIYNFEYYLNTIIQFLCTLAIYNTIIKQTYKYIGH
jgi:hypothetical protein